MAKKDTALAKTDLTAKLDTFAIIRPDFLNNMNEIVSVNMGSSGFSVSDLPKITVPPGGGEMWQLTDIDGSKRAVEFLECVIIHFEDQRIYWAQSFDDGGGGQPPDCMSIGVDYDNNVGRGEPGGDCTACPLNKFGSKGEGTRAKACTEIRNCFLVFPDNVLPVVLKLPPTSLRAARKDFFVKLIGAGLKYTDVLCKIGLKTAKGGRYSVVDFSVAGKLPEEYKSKVAAYADAIRPHLTAAPDSDDSTNGHNPDLSNDF